MTNPPRQRIKRLQEFLTGERPLGQHERRAVTRQILDLQEGYKRGLVWREDQAQRAINFFPLLCHWKGPAAGQPINLEPWQAECLIAPLFGWYWDTTPARRRFNFAYVEIPRKNGKTTIAAGVGLKCLLADDEAGAEVYVGATKFDQAQKLLFRDACQFVRKSPQLTRRCLVFEKSIESPHNSGFMQPVASTASTLDGVNPHCNLIDELHEHKTSDLLDVLQEATTARDNPLTLCITTAGFDRQSVCWEQHQYAELVLRAAVGELETGQEFRPDDAFFAFIAAADQADDWRDPRTWWKASPNLGVSVQREKLASLAQQAEVLARLENKFRRKYLNQWTEQSVRWLSMELWDQCLANPTA